MSSILFKFYLEVVFGYWYRQRRSLVVAVQPQSLHSLLSADDQVLMALDKDNAMYQMRKLMDAYKLWGPATVNVDKIKYLVAGSGQSEDLDFVFVRVRNVEVVKYMASLMDETGQ